MNHANVLYTIGYAGRDLDTFVSSLGRHQIERVVDMREITLLPPR